MKLQSIFRAYLIFLELGFNLSLQTLVAASLPYTLSRPRGSATNLIRQSSSEWTPDLKLLSWGPKKTSYLKLGYVNALSTLKAQGSLGQVEALLLPFSRTLNVEWSGEHLNKIKKGLKVYLHLPLQSGYSVDLGWVLPVCGQKISLNWGGSGWALDWRRSPNALASKPIQIFQFAQKPSSSKQSPKQTSKKQQPQKTSSSSECSFIEDFEKAGEKFFPVVEEIIEKDVPLLCNALVESALQSLENIISPSKKSLKKAFITAPFDSKAYQAHLIELSQLSFEGYEVKKEIFQESPPVLLFLATTFHTIILPRMLVQKFFESCNISIKRQNSGWLGWIFEVEHWGWMEVFGRSKHRELFFKTTEEALKKVWLQNLGEDAKASLQWLTFLKLVPPSASLLEKLAGDLNAALQTSKPFSLGDWGEKIACQDLKTDLEAELNCQKVREKFLKGKGFLEWNTASDCKTLLKKYEYSEQLFLSAKQKAGLSKTGFSKLNGGEALLRNFLEHYWALTPLPIFWEKVSKQASFSNDQEGFLEAQTFELIRAYPGLLRKEGLKEGLEEDLDLSAPQQLASWKAAFEHLGESALLRSVRALLSPHMKPWHFMSDFEKLKGVRFLDWKEIREADEAFWQEKWKTYPSWLYGPCCDHHEKFLENIFKEEDCFLSTKAFQSRNARPKISFFFWDSHTCGEDELQADSILNQLSELWSMSDAPAQSSENLLRRLVSILKLAENEEDSGYLSESWNLHELLMQALRRRHPWKDSFGCRCSSTQVWDKVNLRLKTSLLLHFESWQSHFPTDILRELTPSELHGRQVAIDRLTQLYQNIGEGIEQFKAVPDSAHSAYAAAYQEEVAEFKRLFSDTVIDAQKGSPFDRLNEPVSGFLMKKEIEKLASIQENLKSLVKKVQEDFQLLQQTLQQKEALKKEKAHWDAINSAAKKQLKEVEEVQKQSEPSVVQRILNDVPPVEVYRQRTGNHSSVAFGVGGGGWSISWSWK